MQVTVNGTDYHLHVDFLTYQDVVILSGNPPDVNDLTITYATTRSVKKRHGTLRPGHSIDIDDGMVFDAVRTGAA